MNKLVGLVACFSAMAAMVSAHPTFYPHVDASNGFAPEKPPPILSWHVHICFPLADDTVQRALKLRNQTIAHFAPFLGPECLGRFDDGRLCMIRDHEFTKVLTGKNTQPREQLISYPLTYTCLAHSHAMPPPPHIRSGTFCGRRVEHVRTRAVQGDGGGMVNAAPR